MTRVCDTMTTPRADERYADGQGGRVLCGLGLTNLEALSVLDNKTVPGLSAAVGQDGLWRGPEVGLREALSDPIVRSLMRADRVDPAELEADLAELAAKLARRRGHGTAA